MHGGLVVQDAGFDAVPVLSTRIYRFGNIPQGKKGGVERYLQSTTSPFVMRILAVVMTVVSQLANPCMYEADYMQQ
jgi:hypothetical protein